MLDETIRKFGRPYKTTPDTFKMGIHNALGKEAAKRFSGKVKVADVCTGAGFMALCLAEVVEQVIAVDINEVHLNLVRENSRIAGLRDKFTFIRGDVLDAKILENLSGVEAVYADPEWALPGHRKGDHVRDIFKTSPPVGRLFKQLSIVTPNMAVRLPKETDTTQLKGFPTHEIEAAYLDGKLKAYTVYFGDLIKNEGLTRLDVVTS